MAAATGSRALMGRATLASVGVHVLAALCIPALAWTASTAIPVETVSFVHVTHIEIAQPRRRNPQPRAAAPRHSTAPKVTFAKRVHVTHVAKHHTFGPTHEAPSAQSAAPAVAAVQQTGTASGASQGAPQVTATPAARAVASVGHHQTGGYLPFGAEQPDPVLDPDVHAALANLNVHVTLFVTVGDDGHTENVAFQPSIDPQLEARIRSLLADASWDPAVCGGGVSCEGRATIKL